MSNGNANGGDHLTAVPPVHARADGEHPIERARKALREAALIEGDPWRDLLLRFASSLPERGTQ